MAGKETTRIPRPGELAATPSDVPVGLGDLTDELLAADVWTDDMVVRAGIPIRDVPFVTVGGGIGSFVTVDYLRIAGVHPDQIRVLTVLDRPWQTYEYLTRVSQIPAGERLRSDSASRPDNIWGFPSYAVAEAFSARSLRGFLSPLLQIAVEPIFADYYTPKAGQVFKALDRERDRIGYDAMVVRGQVRMVRRRHGGGYFSVSTPPDGSSSTKRIAYRSRFVHVAVGYPGLKFLPDLQNYREEHQDYQRVVNAYEPHEHVYEKLRQQPGTVLLRGGGIVASRILQRVFDDRHQKGAQTEVVHLFRTYVAGAHGPNIWMRRPGADGWAYQGFNYPKSVWGGQLKYRMRKLEGKERADLYKVFGGTNTPKRSLWRRQLREGRQGGYYKTVTGEVLEVMPGGNGGVVTRVQTSDGVLELKADFIIDATGLEADIGEHRLLADLLEHGGAGRNPLGRLDVEQTFELRGTANGDGAIYASGTATLGGYFPGVDTFLGLQIAAQEICDDLARRGFCRRIRVIRSTAQWLKWARGKKI